MNNLHPHAYHFQCWIERIEQKINRNCCVVAIQLHWLKKMVDKRNCNNNTILLHWMEFKILIQCTSILFEIPHLLNFLTLSKYAFLNFQVYACGFVHSPKKATTPIEEDEKNTFAFLPKQIYQPLEIAYGAGAPIFFLPSPPFPPHFTLFSFVVAFPFPSSPFFTFLSHLALVLLRFCAYSHAAHTNSLNTLSGAQYERVCWLASLACSQTFHT